MTRGEALAALQEAARAETGVLLRVSNVEATVNALSRVAKLTQRPELLRLQFRRVALGDGNLAIINPGPETEGSGQELPPGIEL